MTEEQFTFIRAICDDPKDMAPRLIYADWLDERAIHGERCSRCGDDGKDYNDSTLRERTCGTCNGKGLVREGNGYSERAAFVRRSITATSITGIPHQDYYMYGASNWYEDRLQLGIDVFPPVTSLFVRNGFVDTVRMTLKQFEKHAGELFLFYPIENVEIIDRAVFEGGNYAAYWYNRDRPIPSAEHPESELPEYIFDELKMYARQNSSSMEQWGHEHGKPFRHCMYDPQKSEELGYSTALACGREDLSQACVAVGRKQAERIEHVCRELKKTPLEFIKLIHEINGTFDTMCHMLPPQRKDDAKVYAQWLKNSATPKDVVNGAVTYQGNKLYDGTI